MSDVGAHRELWTVVVAAGTGSRFGGDKLAAALADGRTILEVSVHVAAAVSDGVIVVLRGDDERVGSVDVVGATYVAGGETRSGSVRAGLAAVPDTAELILVHDAARPAASEELYRRVVEALAAGAEAVVPGIAVNDTIRSLDGGVVDRSRLRAIQTPQGFRADVLREAHRGAADATDDAALAEAVGSSVVVVEGDVRNLKVTRPDDLTIVRALLDQH